MHRAISLVIMALVDCCKYYELRNFVLNMFLELAEITRSGRLGLSARWLSAPRPWPSPRIF